MRTQIDRGMPRDIAEYLKFLKGVLHAPIVLLFGSRARKQSTRLSDYDLFVISENLPEDYWKRQDLLWQEKPVGVDVIGMTPGEVRDLIYRGLLLDALLDGKELVGDASEFRERARTHLEAKGLIRTPAGYVHRTIER